MTCRDICERLGCKPTFEYNQYVDAKKYCRRWETYFHHNGLFCPCYAMQLRVSPIITIVKTNGRRVAIIDNREQ